MEMGDIRMLRWSVHYCDIWWICDGRTWECVFVVQILGRNVAGVSGCFYWVWYSHLCCLVECRDLQLFCLTPRCSLSHQPLSWKVSLEYIVLGKCLGSYWIPAFSQDILAKVLLNINWFMNKKKLFIHKTNRNAVKVLISFFLSRFSHFFQNFVLIFFFWYFHFFNI